MLENMILDEYLELVVNVEENFEFRAKTKETSFLEVTDRQFPDARNINRQTSQGNSLCNQNTISFNFIGRDKACCFGEKCD